MSDSAKQATLLVFLGIIAGVLTWLISEPLAPTGNDGLKEGILILTLGSMFGWVSTIVYGALLGGSIAWVSALGKLPPGKLVQATLLGVVFGGPFFCAADAFANLFGYVFAKGGLIAQLSSSFLMEMAWHLSISIAIVGAVWLTQKFMGLRTYNVLISFIAIAFLTIMIRQLLYPIEGALLYSDAMPEELTIESIQEYQANVLWKSWNIPRLLQWTLFGGVIGISFPLSELIRPTATIVFEDGKFQRSHPLEKRNNIIGSGEGATIRLPRQLGVEAKHVSIEHNGHNWFIRDLTGSGFLLNGDTCREGFLSAGDLIQLGSARLRFGKGGEAPKPVQTYDHRLIDPFGKVVPIRGPEARIGSDPALEVCTAYDPNTSPLHASIIFRINQAVIQDLGSSSGTFVNGRRVLSFIELYDGDQVRVGSTLLTYKS